MKPKRRIYDYISVNGTKLLTLFDTVARNTYITRNGMKSIGVKPTIVPRPFKVGLGGKSRILNEDVRIAGLLHGFPIIIHPYLVDDLGVNEKEKGIISKNGLSLPSK